MDTYYIDGEFVQDKEAVVSAKDLTVLRGFGVFDFMITYNKRPFHLKAHVERLENSAREIGLEISHTREEICDIVRQTIEKNSHHDESNVRLVYTGGVSDDGVSPCGNGILMVMVTPRHRLPENLYKEGAKIITVEMERFKPLAKSTNYLSAVYALQEARKAGAIEAVYVDRYNQVLEGTTSTLFCVKNGQILTPPDAILPGVTRRVVLDLLDGESKVALRHILFSELGEMDEMFLTASNKEVLPIVKYNDKIVGQGGVGEKTREVMKAFAAYTLAYGQGNR